MELEGVEEIGATNGISIVNEMGSGAAASGAEVGFGFAPV